MEIKKESYGGLIRWSVRIIPLLLLAPLLQRVSIIDVSGRMREIERPKGNNVEIKCLISSRLNNLSTYRSKCD